MKKLLLIALISFIGLSLIKAQSTSPQVVSSGGDFFENPNAKLSWTVGETITETAEISNVNLTQGFQQSSYTIVNIYEKPESKIDVSVFPNPAIDFINISINNSDEVFEIYLIDINGKTIFKNNSIMKSVNIDLSAFLASSYLLKVKSKDGRLIKTYKIIKNI